MFYCMDCAKQNGWPKTLFRSLGHCEMCSVKAVCNERQSSLLPRRDS